jgi:hypothetical protein
MTDPIKPDTQEPKKKTIVEEIRPKSIRQIVEDAHKPQEEKKEPEKDKLEEDVVAKKKERIQKAKEEEDKKDEELVKKTSDETAKKVAEETKEAFKTEIQKILDKPIDDQAKQKEADELIASWEKDGREKKLPKDYQELIQETQRIAEVKAKRTMDDMLAKRDEEAKVQREKEETEKKTTEEARTKQVENFNKRIETELEELGMAKVIELPEDRKEINNSETKDEKAKNVQKFFEYGIKYNQEQTKKGLPPETSLTKLYFLHYKPEVDANPPKKDEQPAGADAPIAGNNNTPSSEAPKDKYSYSRDHNKSFSQIASDILGNFRRK